MKTVWCSKKCTGGLKKVSAFFKFINPNLARPLRARQSWCGTAANNRMDQQAFQEISITIPSDPGIYKYFDANKELLYVGKAKNLRKRVSSYFNKTFTNYKTYELVKRISSIEFTIVNSEQDAFLLENSLIKEYQPRFNINLKDDKTYPYIVIKKEPFPRVFLTRQRISDGSEYLGPFTSVAKVRELIDFIKSNIPASHLQTESDRVEYRQKEIQGLPRISPGQLQRPLRRIANRSGLSGRPEKNKKYPQGKPRPGDQ